jgi:Predicted transcriptional regulator
MDLNERIKMIRKMNCLSQDDFGKYLKITKASISRLESGINNPSEQTIALICSEFNINEHWLRTGEGSPTKDLSPTEEVETLVRKVIDYNNRDEKNPFYDMIIDMMKTYHDLDPESQLVIQDYFKNLRLTIISKDLPDTVESQIDKKVAKYRRELELEARQAEKLSAYGNIADTDKKQA